MRQAFQCVLARVALIAAAILPATLPTKAQTQQQLDWCINKGAPTPDVRISSCTTAIELGSLSRGAQAIAFFNRGAAYYDKGHYDRAIADLDRAIQLNPQLAQAFNNRGIAYRRIGQYDRAIADYDQAILLDPKNASSYNNRCRVRAIVGRELQQALADCNESLRLRTNDDYTLDNRGMTYLKLGQIDNAINDYNAALKIDPKKAGSLYGRGVAKLKKGNITDGNADIAAAKAIQADVVEEYAKYGIQP